MWTKGLLERGASFMHHILPKANHGVNKLNEFVQSIVKNNESTVYMKAYMSETDKKHLETFLDTGDTMLLDHLFGNITLVSHSPIALDVYWKWDTLFYISCTVLCLFMLIQQARFLSLTRMLGILIITSFVISVPWTWYKLYLTQLAKHQVAMISDRPKSCGKRPSVFAFVKQLFTFSMKDECLHYHEALLIHPMLEVPPTKALAVTLTAFVFEPLEHIGTALSRTLQNILMDLPIYMWPFATMYLLFATLLGIVMIARYKTNFFHLVSIEPMPSDQCKTTREQQSVVRQV